MSNPVLQVGGVQEATILAPPPADVPVATPVLLTLTDPGSDELQVSGTPAIVVPTESMTVGVIVLEVLVEDVIDALRRMGPVEVSELTGRQETIEFRLPPELTDGTAASRRAAATA